jgi:hypothetical protein
MERFFLEEACFDSRGRKTHDKWRRPLHTSFLAALLELRVSISGARTLGLTLSGCTWQWWLSIHFFLKILSGDWTFFRVKTQDLTSSPTGRRWCLCIDTFLEASFSRSLFRVEVLSSLVVLLLLRVFDYFGGFFILFFLLLFFGYVHL